MVNRLRQLVFGKIQSVVEILLLAVFPQFCVVCGQEGEVICDACLSLQKSRLDGIFGCPKCAEPTVLGRLCENEKCRSESFLDGVVAVAPYANKQLSALMRSWKYGGEIQAEQKIVEIFSDFWRERPDLLKEFSSDAVVVPVPMHWLRLADRGFNQADALAKSFGLVSGCKFSQHLLRRNFRRHRQAELHDKNKRRQNASGSVSLSRGATIPARIILVDDVFTSGATLQECAAVLKKAGCKEVWSATVFRG